MFSFYQGEEEGRAGCVAVEIEGQALSVNMQRLPGVLSAAQASVLTDRVSRLYELLLERGEAALTAAQTTLEYAENWTLADLERPTVSEFQVSFDDCDEGAVDDPRDKDEFPQDWLWRIDVWAQLDGQDDEAEGHFSACSELTLDTPEDQLQAVKLRLLRELEIADLIGQNFEDVVGAAA